MLHSLLLVFISTSSRSTHKYLFRNTSICNFLKFIFTENYTGDSKITKSLHCDCVPATLISILREINF